MKARPYQVEAVQRIFSALSSHRSALAVAATGTGKTFKFAELCRQWPAEWGRILILAHRRELIFQAYKMLRRVCPADRIDIEMGERRAAHHPDLFGPPSRVVVASKDTLCEPARLKRFDPSQFGLVVVDEAHHAVKKNKTYWTILKHFNKAKWLGVTATPDRADMEAMGGVFETIAFVYDILQAVTDSWLVPILQQRLIVDGLDFSKLKLTEKGDFDPDELDLLLRREQVIHGIVDPVIALANQGGKQRRTLLFASSVDQARSMAAIINRQCPGKAAALSGEDDSDVRKYQLERFGNGEIQFMCGCEIFTEGFDEPKIQIVVPKMTLSRAKYAQMIGRGTRTWPGLLDGDRYLHDAEARRQAIRASPKPSLLVVDPHGVSGQHKLVTTLDILGGVFSPEALREAEKKMNGGGRLDTLAELRRAREELRQREEERKKAIVLRASYSLQEVDPFDLFAVKRVPEPTYLRGRLATEKQLEYIQRHSPEGARISERLTRHEASVIIDKIVSDKAKGPPSEKMALALQRFGYDTTTMTYADAKTKLEELAANNWQATGPSHGGRRADETEQ